MSFHPSTIRPLFRNLLSWCLAACAALAAAPASAAAQPDPITVQAEDNYWYGDFAALEKQYLELRRGPPLREDASLNLELFRIGLARVVKNAAKYPEPYLRELESLTLQWADEHPKSALAHILHASVLAAHGWSYRGGGYANTVTPEAMEQFHRYLRQAAEYLKAHGDVVLTDSSTYVELLNLGNGLGWDPANLEVIADAGLKLAPYDVALYFKMVTALLPKWQGNVRMLDDYIRRVTEQTQAQFGTGMYARLYSAAAEEQFSHRLFKDSYANWDKMKRSYEDMQARYPNSPIRRNGFAYMACMAKDKPTLRALLAELGPKLDAAQWGDNPQRTLDGCQSWANEP